MINNKTETFEMDEIVNIYEIIDISSDNIEIEYVPPNEIFFRKKLLIHEFDDYAPLSDKKYFGIDNDNNILEADNKNLPVLIIGVSFYDEDAYELRRILTSLADQISDLNGKIICRILLVGDGFSQMSHSAQEYLRLIFCKNSDDDTKWRKMISTFQKHTQENVDKTYILQCVNHDSESLDYTREQVTIPGTKDNSVKILPLSLLLKTKNRKKYNSQQWILSGFMHQSITTSNINRYVLLSDCGTYFESGCFNRMIKYMDTHPKCVGCTCRQRIMTNLEQDCSDEKIFSFSNILRKIQQADYEMTYAIHTAAFSTIGYLPVLPGPCVMIRAASLFNKQHKKEIDPIETLLSQKNIPNTETAYEHFVSLLETPKEKTGIVIENVKLAEDRILSYALITHGEKESYTTWIDGAVFKTQAETSLKSLLFQRRRWINGTFMCFIWNLFIKPEHITSSKHNLFRKFFIFFLLFVQFLNYILSLLTPAIFGSTLYLSLEYLFKNKTLVYTLLVCYHLYMILFMWLHKFYDYIQPVFCFCVFINIVGMIIILIAYIKQLIHFSFGLQAIIQFVVAGLLALPFIMAIVSLNIRSLILIIFSFIPYILFLPTMVGTFTIYAMARLSDTSWGNRTDKSLVLLEQKKNSIKKKSDNVRNDINANASTILLFVTVTNLVVQAFLVYFSNRLEIMLILIFVMILPICIQLLLSIFYFLVKHISCSTYQQRISYS